jgi:microcystin-dependent protein
MATRQIEFITGVETATQPAVQNPVNDEDLITLGYANRNYQQGTQSVASIVDVKAIVAANRKQGDVIFVTGIEYEYWYDSASSAVNDDFFVLIPDDSPATGRWKLRSILDKQVTLTDTTQSTDKDTGAVVLEGGLGVEKNVNVGGILNVVTSATINDLTTTGTTTFVNSTDLNVTDANITCNVGGDEAAADLASAGLTVEMSDAADAIMAFNSGLTSKWKCGDVSSSSEIMTVGTAQTISGLKRNAREAEFAPITTPGANPSSGLKVYAKSDDKLYTLDSVGNEVEIGSGAASGAVPVGTITGFAGGSAPSGYFMCDGSEVSRVTYSNLFTVLGTLYGVGDGSTTFNLPDLRGEFLRGLDNMGTAAGARGVDTGRTLGTNQTETTSVNGLTGNANISHTHNSGTAASAGNHSHSVLIFFDNGGSGLTTNATGNQRTASTYNAGNTSNTGAHTHTVTVPAHSGNGSVSLSGDAETRPRNVALNYIIKA